jgi:diguanylate cyclase (GGDEF)-like protein
MFDVRSLFIVMVVTHVVLAASLWLGTGRRFRDGMGEWTLSLLSQAIAVALFAARGHLPDWLSIVIANVALAVSISLYAAAIRAFRGIATPVLLHGGVAIFTACLCAALIDHFAARVMAFNLLLAAAQVALIATAWKPIEGVLEGTRVLLVGSFAGAATSLLLRSFGPSLYPESFDGFLTPSVLQTVTLLINYAVVLTGSVSFLLMQKERAEHIAQQLASLDPLTGTFNRRTFIELAEKELSHARRVDAPVSLIMLDLDHFKRVNDTHGHLVGDHVLQHFADLVRTQLRQEDILVRFGGEEFCVLLPDVAGPGAVALAGRIRRVVEAAPLRVDGLEIAVTTSAGVAARIDEGPEGLDRLIGRADEALYVAKHRGRNRVAAISPGKMQAA